MNGRCRWIPIKRRRSADEVALEAREGGAAVRPSGALNIGAVTWSMNDMLLSVFALVCTYVSMHCRSMTVEVQFYPSDHRDRSRAYYIAATLKN